MVVAALLEQFRERSAQENSDPGQLALVDGHIAKIAAKLRAEQSCKHCGKPLASWNESGYCTEHHRPCDRAKRFCAVCGERLRSDTPGNLCLECRLKNLPEKRFCWACLIEDGPVLAMPLSRWLMERELKWPASGMGLTQTEMQFLKSEHGIVLCGEGLNSPNEHGYCPKHHYLTRLKPVWGRCKEPDCNARINLTTNTTGYCRRHRFPGNRPSRQPQFCSECKAPLPADNKSGLCPQHIHLKYHPRVEKKTCQAAQIIGPGNECTMVLGANNKSGLCADHFMARYGKDPEHRAAAARRMQAFRARKEEQAEAAQSARAKAEADLKKLQDTWSDVGRTAEDQIWARVDELYGRGLKWSVIQVQVDKEFGFSRTIKAYQEGRKRYLARQKKNA